MKNTLLDGTPWGYLFGLEVDTDDLLVREVISQIEYCLDKHALAGQYESKKGPSGEHIEVEGRLGVFVDPYTHERLKLPVQTEALLEESMPNGEFSYKFASSLSQYHFDCFARTICQELGLSTAGEAEGIISHQPLSRELPRDTMDVFVSYATDNDDGADEDKKMRISYDPDGRTMLEAIRKEPFIKMNVYSGLDAHEDEVQLLVNESGEYGDDSDELKTAVDFRISINKESSVAPQVVADVLASSRERSDTFRRRRQRKSYPIFGIFRVDMTVVQNIQGHGQYAKSKTSHEIELEINPYVLYHHYLKKVRGDSSQKLDVIVANFVQILRSWVAFLNTNGTAELITRKKNANQASMNSYHFGASLKDCAVPEATLAQYLKYVSPVVPLIGDYAFRCVVEHCRNLPQQMTQEDIEDSTRLHLNEQELEQLRERQTTQAMSLGTSPMPTVT